MEPGQWIRPVGSDIQAGATVLAAGEKLGAAEIGILATVGAASVKVNSTTSAARRSWLMLSLGLQISVSGRWAATCGRDNAGSRTEFLQNGGFSRRKARAPLMSAVHIVPADIAPASSWCTIAVLLCRGIESFST